MTAPLGGCRILDLGIITAGAATSALLADLGAEVIKVESPHYRDPFRQWTRTAGADQPMPPFFRATNRNKQAISIDLKHVDGRDAFLRLVANSDIVIENFRRGVLSRLSLDYEALRAVNPNIVLASVSSQGDTGPDAGHVSYGSTLEAVGGLAWATGYAGDGPVVSGREFNYPDQVAAIFSAGMIVAAWRAARAGAGGAHLDISQRELTSFLCGEMFVAASEFGDEARRGNAGYPYRLQDCFRAADDVWVAVTIGEEDVAALEKLIGLARDNDVGLRGRMQGWIAARDGASAASALAAAGIAAAPAHDGYSLLADEGKTWGMALARAPDGAVLKGFPFQLAQTPLTIRRDAPRIGADTGDILMRVGGYSAAEVAALARVVAVEIAPD